MNASLPVICHIILLLDYFYRLRDCTVHYVYLFGCRGIVCS